MVDFLFFWRIHIFADPKILLYFTSNLGSIVPLFPVEKNKKNILEYYFALFFSQTELPKHVVASGRKGGCGDLQYNTTHRRTSWDSLYSLVILSLGFMWFTDVAGLHVIHFSSPRASCDSLCIGGVAMIRWYRWASCDSLFTTGLVTIHFSPLDLMWFTEVARIHAIYWCRWSFPNTQGAPRFSVHCRIRRWVW